MTDIEKKLKELVRLKEKVTKAEKAVEDFILANRENCVHPQEALEATKYHHGYGKYIDGNFCKLCRKYSLWNKWVTEFPSFNRGWDD